MSDLELLGMNFTACILFCVAALAQYNTLEVSHLACYQKLNPFYCSVGSDTMICLPHILVEGCLGGFYLLAVVNTAAVCLMHVLFSVHVHSFLLHMYRHWSGIAGP